MTPNALTQWQTALRYLIDAKDAPPAAQADAKHAMDAHKRATQLHADEQHTAHTYLQTLRTQERDLPRTALQTVKAGKRLNLDGLLHDLEQTRTAHTFAQARAQVTQHVRTACENQVTGNCLLPHSDELLLWIATRRNAVPFQCGNVDTLPDPVHTIYNLVCPTWWEQWTKGLELDALTRLPLLYLADWSTDLRASLAWVWEQVALGEIEKIPHPTAGDQDTAPQVYVPTKRYVKLPHVPPVVKPPAFPF